MQFIDKHLAHMGKGLDILSSKYDKYTLMGDFNPNLSNNFGDSFLIAFSHKSLIKNQQSVTKIDLHPLPFIQCWLQVFLVIPGHHCLA